jgi:hypothetical protein
VIVAGATPRTTPYAELRNAFSFELNDGDIMIGARPNGRVEVDRNFRRVIFRDIRPEPAR